MKVKACAYLCEPPVNLFLGDWFLSFFSSFLFICRSMVFMYQPKKIELKNALICSLEPRVDTVVSNPDSRSQTVEILGFVVVNDGKLCTVNEALMILLE